MCCSRCRYHYRVEDGLDSRGVGFSRSLAEQSYSVTFSPCTDLHQYPTADKMSKLSYGLNLTKKAPSIPARPPPAKRKTIFDDDSGPEDGPDDQDNAEAVTTIGGLQATTAHSNPTTKPSNGKSPNRPLSKLSKISQFGDLSTNHTTSKHARSAQTIDPSIYDYDAVYDSLHSAPKPTDPSTTSAEAKSKPKYMTSLLAAAEVRKRDALRAKEKMLAREREAEGDEFADKEKFVTAAYKRQQTEMARLEAEEVDKEREAEERRRREGGGMKGLYKSILERNEEKHRDVVKAVEENKGKVVEGAGTEEVKKEKSEADLAKETGAVVNEEGVVVDKRQLLSAGLNASKSGTTAKRPSDPRKLLVPERAKRSGGRGGGRETSRERETRLFEEQLLGKSGSGSAGKETSRDRETRLFEEQLLGKRAMDDDSDDERAAKSRKLEDEILGKFG